MEQRSLKSRHGPIPPLRTAADLGRLIRSHRQAAGLTQKDLAMQTGVSLPTVSAIENGKETAQIGIVLALCADLGIRLGVMT